MIFYLTYNDLPSGIYASQVIDVVNFIRIEKRARIKLIAFISIRGFRKNRIKIKKAAPSSIIIPMFPGVHRWRYNKFSLCILRMIYRPKKVIGRSVLATLLAMEVFKKKVKIVYDGRGAISAEWGEYNVVQHKELKINIRNWEQKVITESDFRIAISEALVKHWNRQFSYNHNAHIVIPCTLNKVYEVVCDHNQVARLKRTLGFDETTTSFVFSGSLAGWQSLPLLSVLVKYVLQKDVTYQVLFLSDNSPMINELSSEFPNRIRCMKVLVDEVPLYLSTCDYGILVRENSVTNEVSSPVKFAEYLACGLNVIISENLGDYTHFVRENQCGSVYTPGQPLVLTPVSKQKNRDLALTHFTKRCYEDAYDNLISH